MRYPQNRPRILQTYRHNPPIIGNEKPVGKKMSSSSATEDKCTGDESCDQFFASQVIEAQRMHDRGIDLCYVYHDYSQSLQVLYMAAHLRESLLGKFHADTALSYFRIFSILIEYQSNYVDGLRMARRELRLSHRIFADHNNAALSKSKLLTSKQMKSQTWLSERLSCIKAVLMNVQEDISEKEYKKYCKRLLRSVALEQLGDSYADKKDWENALTQYNNAMALECNAYARNLLDTADLQVKMSDCLVGMKDYESAVDELKHAARKYQQVLSIDLGNDRSGKGNEHEKMHVPHSAIGEIHSKIGSIFLSQKKCDDALGEYAKAYSQFETCLGKSHARSLEALADIKVVTVLETEYLREEQTKLFNHSEDKAEQRKNN